MPDSTSSHVEVPPAARFPGDGSEDRRAPLSRVRRRVGRRRVERPSRVCGAVSGAAASSAPLACAAAQVCDGRQPCNGRPSRVCGGVSRRAVSGGAVSGGAVSSAPLACAAAWPAASNARRHQRSSARLEGAVSCRAVSGGAVSGGDSPGCAPLCIDRSHAPKSRVLGALSASSQPAFMNQRPCR